MKGKKTGVKAAARKFADRTERPADAEKVCTGLELSKALRKTELTDEEAQEWWRDLQAARNALKRGNRSGRP